MKEVSGVAEEFPSYVNYHHCGLYDRRQIVRGLDEVVRPEQIEE